MTDGSYSYEDLSKVEIILLLLTDYSCEDLSERRVEEILWKKYQYFSPVAGSFLGGSFYVLS